MSEQVFIPLFLDKKMWDSSKPMLFLSELYLLQLSDKEKEDWRYTLLDAYESIYKGECWTYVAPFVDSIISVLEVELSRVHRVNYSHDYWHRLLFAWLEKYCVLKYYQVNLFEKIRKLYPHTKFCTWVYEYESNGIWNEELEFNVISSEMEYFSRVAKIGESFFDLTVVKKEASFEKEVVETCRKGEFLPKRSLIGRMFQKDIGTKVLYRIFCKRPKKDVKALYINSYLNSIDLHRMVTLSHGRIRPISLGCELNVGKTNTVFRQQLKKVFFEKVKCESLWQKVCVTFLAEELSAVFIEWYAQMHEVSLRYISEYPNLKVIRGLSDFYYSNIVPFCAFLAKERKGVKILGMQHGGNYGIGKNDDYVEKCEEDIFYGWGNWAEQRGSGYKWGPSGKLYQYTSSEMSNDYILFVGTYIPTKIAEGSIQRNSRDGMRYIRWQLKFFKALNKNVISNVAVRNYYVDVGWRLNEILEKEIPGIYITNKTYDSLRQVDFSARDDDFVVALSHSRMLICDHFGTTWLEALAANKPLLMFFPKNQWLYEESEIPYIKMMEDVGILVHSPEEASETLNKIASDIDAWWNEPNRKRVVKVLKERYALMEKDVARWWVKELLTVAEE